MIILENVTKKYPTRDGVKTVLDNINLTIRPGDKVGILGGNGAGKSTLIRLLSGVEWPTSGKIIRKMKVSWPLAFAGGFQGSLTGYDNLRFICRVYGTDIPSAKQFVEDFSELGAQLREPFKYYSSGMRARFAFALSMAIEFDCYLIDEITAVGDSRFQERCREELFVKRKDRAFILVSHSPTYIRKHCHRATVLRKGRLTKFNSINEAYKFYETR